MKPFWGTDLTHDKHNEVWNGDEFCVQRPSAEQAKALAEASGQAQNLMKQANLPGGLGIVKAICGLGVLVVVAGMAGRSSDISLAQAYENASSVFWIGGACAIVFLVLFLMERFRAKKSLGSSEGEATLSNLVAVVGAIHQELGIPKDAISADILAVNYSVKDGEPMPNRTTGASTPWLNREAHIFVEGGNLCIADMDGKHAIPLSSLRGIQTVQKKIYLPVWNKDTPMDKPPYKQYKIFKDSFGFIVARRYHILKFVHRDEDWGVYFPNYELPAFEKLTNLKAE